MQINMIPLSFSKPTVEKDVPSRWCRGGGLEQPCQYIVWCGRLILQKITKDLQDLEIPYQVASYLNTGF